MLFDQVWRNIQRLSGSPFQQALGKTFTYQANQGFLKPSATNRNLLKSDFARAFAARPLKNVRQVKELRVQGPSYVFAILNDGRVISDESTSSPTVSLPRQVATTRAAEPRSRRRR